MFYKRSAVFFSWASAGSKVGTGWSPEWQYVVQHVGLYNSHLPTSCISILQDSPHICNFRSTYVYEPPNAAKEHRINIDMLCSLMPYGHTLYGRPLRYHTNANLSFTLLRNGSCRIG